MNRVLWFLGMLLLMGQVLAYGESQEDMLIEKRGRIASKVLSSNYVYYEVKQRGESDWVGAMRYKHGDYRLGDCIQYFSHRYAKAYKMPTAIRGNKETFFFSGDIGNCRDDNFAVRAKSSRRVHYDYIETRALKLVSTSKHTYIGIWVGNHGYWINGSRNDTLKVGDLIRYQVAKPIQSYIKDSEANLTFPFNLLFTSYEVVSGGESSSEIYQSVSKKGTRVFTDRTPLQ